MRTIIAALNFILLSSLNPAINPINALHKKNTLAQVTRLSRFKMPIEVKARTKA